MGTVDRRTGDGVGHVHDLPNQVKPRFAQVFLQFFRVRVMHQLPGQLPVKPLSAMCVGGGVCKGFAEYFLLVLARFQVAYQVFDVAFVHFFGNYGFIK
ncbi:hypothetical protein D3C80_1753520 [compost metagenome]